jgi:hypothetical protein
MNEELKNKIVSTQKEKFLFKKIDIRIKLNKWQEFSIGFLGCLLLIILSGLILCNFGFIGGYFNAFFFLILPIGLLMYDREWIGIGIFLGILFYFLLVYATISLGINLNAGIGYTNGHCVDRSF